MKVTIYGYQFRNPEKLKSKVVEMDFIKKEYGGSGTARIPFCRRYSFLNVFAGLINAAFIAW